MPSIRHLVSSVLEGRVRIPAFQRGFVWDADRVAKLMDSIYKGYPFGALLFWRTKNMLKTERDLGPFVLPPRPEDYPIDYVLDGQQRLTSIFGVFQTELPADETTDWSDIYFDIRGVADAQDSLFLPLASDQVDPVRYFPLSVLFDASKYGAAFRRLPDDVVPIVDELHSRFKEVDVPVQTFVTDDRAGVAIVFERVNTQGVELDTLQLLSAWTWSDDFDLQGKFGELSDELAPFGFSDVGEDVTLLLRACAAIVEHDASPKTIVSMKGPKVRREFPLVVNGLRGAIDFVRKNLGVQDLRNLPYASVLVPLAVFHASTDGKEVRTTDYQRSQIMRWFWKSCFGARYGRQVTRSLEVDINQMIALRAGLPSKLDEISVSIEPEFFKQNRFNLNTVATRTFVLMLAQRNPKSFVSGQGINLASVLQSYNRNEFHHIFPQAFLRASDVSSSEHSPLANLCFINAVDNKALGGSAPSIYWPKLARVNLDEVLDRALCPRCELESDDFPGFIDARSRALAIDANRLMNQS